MLSSTDESSTGDVPATVLPTMLPTAEESPTIDLWPTAGQALGLGRTTTYRRAAEGDFPGAMKVGPRLYRVATAEFRRALGLDGEAVTR